MAVRDIRSDTRFDFWTDTAYIWSVISRLLSLFLKIQAKDISKISFTFPAATLCLFLIVEGGLARGFEAVFMQYQSMKKSLHPY